MMRRCLCLPFLVCVVAPSPVRAQTADELVRQAQAAFQNLEFEEAARLFTRVLDAASGATPLQRDSAQIYLGVSYEYAGQRDNALSTFRAFIGNNACAQSPEMFGAGVTSAFLEAKSQVFAVGLCQLQAQTLLAGEAARFQLTMTRPATISATLQDSTGQTVAQLGVTAGDVTAMLEWTPVDTTGFLSREPRPFTLVVRAREQQGAGEYQRAVPLTIYSPQPDTLEHSVTPPDSLLRPEMRSNAGAVGDMLKGLLFGVGAAAIGTSLAYESLGGETTKAIAVGAAISLTGIISFIKGSSNLVIQENRNYNFQLSETWRAQSDSIAALNQETIRGRRVIIEPVEGRGGS